MKISLLVFSFLIPFLMFGQIKIFNESLSQDITNGAITVTGNDTDNIITIHLKIKNASATENYNVYAKKVVVSTVAGSTNDFCFAGNCYTGNVSTSFATIVPNATDSTFSAYYYPWTYPGSSVIQFKFFAAHTDTVSVDITFNALSSGVDENITNTNFISAPFPNPSNSFTTFKYSLLSKNNSYYSIHNILGEEIKRSDITSKNGIIKINTSNLTSGLYFCTFFSEGKVVKTQKFTVSK